MVAITTPSPVHRPPARPADRRLRAVPEHRPGAPWSRAARLVGVAALVALFLVSMGHLATSPAMLPGAAGAPATLDPHVVAPGETMWSIAQEIAPAGEAATYVERLVDANGGAGVEAGQVLTVPVP